MKLLGLNVDPLRGDFDWDAVAETGTPAVRVVLRLGAYDDCASFMNGGVKVLGVVAKETVAEFRTWDLCAEYYAHWMELGAVTWLQIGNEPDITSPSSWTMTFEEYQALLSAFRGCQPQIGAGLASGNHDLRLYHDIPLALHPYSEGTGIASWLDRYRSGEERFWITEWFPNEEATRIALQQPDVEAVFWWWHDPIGTGQLQINDRPQRLAAFKRLVQEVRMPTFQFGFAEYAKAHPEVGKPLSEERYFAEDLSCQLAEGGMLVYAKESNEIRFLPSGKV